MTLGICLVGAGRIGTVHAGNIQAHDTARLVCVADPAQAVAKKLADSFGVESTTDVAAAVARPDVDAVLIASPAPTHPDVVSLAIAANKPMFCEKPLAMTLEGAKKCAQEVEASGLPFFIGFNRRFEPSFASVKERINAGAIGAVETVVVISRDPAPPPISYVETSGGIFRDMTIHDFDMARWLLGEEPTQVTAMGSVLIDPDIGKAGDVDTASITLRTESGKLCTIQNSRRAAHGYDQRVEVFGSTGMLQAHNPLPTTVTHYGAQGAQVDAIPTTLLGRYASSYALELAAFVAALRSNSPMATSVQDGLRALELAEAAQKALETGQTVQL